MTAPVTVSERDLRTLLGIVSDDRSDLPAAGLPLSLLAELKDQVRCDVLSFFGVDSDRQMDWFGQDIPADCDDDEVYDQGFWEHFWDFDPCTYPQRSGDVRSVTKISDFYSARQLHRTGMYCDYLRPLGIEHDLRVCLADGPGRIAGQGRSVDLVLFRGPGPDFSERDRALLALLRPHLYHAYLDAERRRSSTPQLTPRHWELLDLVAAGHTNAQIGRRLGVSEANRSQAPGEHLHQAAGVEPYRRSHPRVPRPGTGVADPEGTPGAGAGWSRPGGTRMNTWPRAKPGRWPGAGRSPARGLDPNA